MGSAKPAWRDFPEQCPDCGGGVRVLTRSTDVDMDTVSVGERWHCEEGHHGWVDVLDMDAEEPEAYLEGPYFEVNGEIEVVTPGEVEDRARQDDEEGEKPRGD